ncbi:MAG: cobalamin-dependent protein [Dehalococcoidales bacterium]|nr:cobalamin-dependent protein [Dehalococcoidales bacterium]
MSEEYVKLLADLEEEKIIELTNKRIAAGENPMNILDDARAAMGVVGKRFADGEYFLPELVFSGELLNSITALVKPLLAAGEGDKQKKHGKVVIGTVAGDIHDIGLNIVEFMLDVNGFDVTNLGVDVSIEKFVEAVKKEKPPVLGLSGFLTPAFDAMKETVEALDKAGLRDGLKIMIGGGQMDDEVKKYAKADAFGKDAMAAVALSKNWMGVK